MIDVITVGTATRDVFLRSGVFRVVHDPEHLRKIGFPSGEAECLSLGAKIEIERPVFAVGGGAANAAVTFARQGFKTLCLAKVGVDLSAREVERTLAREKIQLVLLKDARKGTAFSVVLLSSKGERTIMNYRGASQDLTDWELSAVRDEPRFVYLAPGRVPFGIVLNFAKRMKKRGARLAINPSAFYLAMGLRKLSPLLNLMDVVMVNKEEAADLTGVPLKKEDKIFRIFDEHVKGLAVMTAGQEGVSVSNGRTVFQAGVFPKRDIVDRTGAGDAFGSGFVAALLKSKMNPSAGKQKLKLSSAQEYSDSDIEEAIRLGSANASSVIEAVGAQGGILTARQFADPRWRRLPVMKRTLA